MCIYDISLNLELEWIKGGNVKNVKKYVANIVVNVTFYFVHQGMKRYEIRVIFCITEVN